MTPKQAKPKPGDLIGTDEASRLLGLNRRTVQRMVKAGKLKGYTQPIKAKGKPAILIDRREIEQLQNTVIEVKPE